MNLPPDSPERRFLRENMDDYLFRDLDSMLSVAPTRWNDGGGLGYPIVMACCSGIELLGQIMSLRDVDGPIAFSHFWSQYLYPSDEHREEIAKGVYEAARHGIAHLFLLKHSLRVVLKNPIYHLRNDDRGSFYVDAAQLASDLRTAYETHVLPMCEKDASDRHFQRFSEHIRHVSSGLRPNHRVAPSVPSAGPPVAVVRPSSASDADSNLPNGYNASASGAFPIFPSGPR